MGRNFQRQLLNNKTLGQAMVEFALALPIFLMLVLGIFEVARMLMAYTSAYSAAREASRYAASIGVAPSGEPRYRDCVGIREAAKRAGIISGIEDANILIRYDPGPTDTEFIDLPACPQEVTMGDRILVRVQVTYTPLIGLIPGLQPFTMTSINARTIVKDLDVLGTPGPSPMPRSTRTPTSTNTPTPTRTVTPGPSLTPTFTRTATIEPTVTMTPTETLTPTITLIPSITPTITETLEPTLTPTYCPPEICEPTATATQTPTNTITPTSTPDCTHLVLGGISHFSNKKDTLKAYNLGSKTETIKSIYVAWTNANDNLLSTVFGSSTIWSGSKNTPATISTFNTGAVLTLLPNNNKDIVFSYTSAGHLITYVKVTWTNGCESIRSQ
jgi:hypothetical protein